ncbi:MAG TPA: hypothetical protein VG712_06290, partial [Gemmatimonadales bacterium]|nr:hypothetical protein [Gemmatimonadales bacterium]
APHLAPRTSHAQSHWRTDDRVVLGAMLEISAVASSFDRLYLVSPDQVLIRDDLARRWTGPFRGPGRGLLAEARGSIVDPFDRSLWIVTASGWLRYDPTLDLWDQGFAGGTVIQAGLDRTRPSDGLYLLLTTGWVVTSRGGGSAFPATRPPRTGDLARVTTPDDAIRANPQLAGIASGTLMGPGLRPARLTAVAEAADRSGWWLGTEGAGLLWLPFGSVRPEPRPWGLPGDVVGAVYAVPGGAWAVTDQSYGAGAALVHVPEGIEGITWYFGDQVMGQPFRQVRALRAVDSLLWIGTDQGAVAVDRSGARVRRLTEGDGLPDRRVFAIAARRGRLVFGTARGVAQLTDSGVVQVAPAYLSPALAVAVAGDTTWVGTPNGLFAGIPGEADLLQAPGWDRSATLRTPVVALLWRGDTLVALTAHEVVWRDPRNGAWTIDPDFTSRLGKGSALADGDHGIWIAGAKGAGFARLGAPVERLLAVGPDLPDQAWDVSLDGEWLWIATSRGLVRFRRSAVEP